MCCANHALVAEGGGQAATAITPVLLQDFLNWWHLLVYVEGVIYQADEENEQAAASGNMGPAGQPAPDCSGEHGYLHGALEAIWVHGLVCSCWRYHSPGSNPGLLPSPALWVQAWRQWRRC